ncbi:MAG: antibiotic biosynthesis monooxygenase family protein [Pseudomonadota bacterium]
MRNLVPLLIVAVASAAAIGAAAPAEESDRRFVQLAEIKVDPEQIASYRTALRQEIETSKRLEPGVLALLAVARKDDPSRVTILEVYASPEAYDAHRKSASFKSYKAATARMVKSLTLIPSSPMVLGDVEQKMGKQ